MEYSKFLASLLENAGMTASRGGIVSSARFFCALLEVYGDGLICEDQRISDIIGGLKLDLKKARGILLDYINGDGDYYKYVDGIYMKARLSEAEADAERNGEKQVTAYRVLCRILDLPDKIIKKTLEGAACRNKSKEEQLAAKEEIVELTNQVKVIQQTLLGEVFGQDNAVNLFISGYFQSRLTAMTDANRSRPCATYLFAGPSGVGKTFLAESAAKALKLPFMRFDMSEYCDKESALEFCGSDKVYKNGNSGNFTRFVSENPRSVVLFDEIEKAHLSIIHLFLQILDAGRIRDSYTDSEISLKDVIMIFTTNAGRQLYENAEHGDFSGVSRKVILKALRNDVDPVTRTSYFPSAICSRFASGNVVMFNYMVAHDLYRIANKELARHAKSFEEQFGVGFNISPEVATAILFAEGVSADARTVRSRAESFFNNELFELFRLLSGKNQCGERISDIERIDIDIEIPKCNKQLHRLFYRSELPRILIYSSQSVASRCAARSENCRYFYASDIKTADLILKTNDIEFVMIDMNYGRVDECNSYLNIEDVNSSARDFFWHIRLTNGDIPVYVVQTEEYTFDEEEKMSLKRQGVRGFLWLSDENDGFDREVDTICRSIHQQKNLQMLARSNKLISFETAQYLTEGGKVAKITLFDFEPETAVDPEDTNDVLGSMSKPDVKMDHVIGVEDAKTELFDFVEYLQNPKKYGSLGIKPPKGVLLYGPPGTGKTMLAKALAAESDVTFITAEGNQFQKKQVGEGAEKMHELFRTARKYAPSILFIDEIDAIGGQRGEFTGQQDSVLTALLTEMDGFRTGVGNPVFLLAATNYGIEPGEGLCLDPSLVRRFDRRLYIGLPNLQHRVEYMTLRVGDNKIFNLSHEAIQNIASRSEGMSLAQLDSVFDMALRRAVRDGADPEVTDADLEEVFEAFVNGGKNSR